MQVPNTLVAVIHLDCDSFQRLQLYVSPFQQFPLHRIRHCSDNRLDLFPQVAKKFFEQRKANREEKTVVIPDTQPAAGDAADNSVRTIYVEDMTEGMPL